MTWGSNKMHFTYDSIGPMSVIYNGTEYFYLMNAQGDITGIIDATGNQVVSYIYDPWGAPVSTKGTLASTLGTANPLRYRAYIYDTETKLYYLNSRYYNPVWGRFINADEYASTNTNSVKSANAFAYCENDPVNKVDGNGDIPLPVIGALIGGVTNALATAINGGSAGEIVESALVGATLGAMFAYTHTATLIFRIGGSIANGLITTLSCHNRGVSWGTSIACGLLTTATTMATSSLSARFGEHCLEAAVTDLTFGFGGNLVSTTVASNVPADPKPKNTYKGGISKQKQELQQRRYGSWSKWGKGMRPEYV